MQHEFSATANLEQRNSVPSWPGAASQSWLMMPSAAIVFMHCFPRSCKKIPSVLHVTVTEGPNLQFGCSFAFSAPTASGVAAPIVAPISITTTHMLA
jgi:CHASE2 domain-containing sensor protein